MSVELEKNRNDIINAWKDVVDSKSDTDWWVHSNKISAFQIINQFYSCTWYVFRALFGYEGHTNTLKVVGTGNGGLIELTEELNSGKILYGFLNITDDKTNLTKYLLINWQV